MTDGRSMKMEAVNDLPYRPPEVSHLPSGLGLDDVYGISHG